VNLLPRNLTDIALVEESLLKLQQEYYRNENERHKLDMKKQLSELRNINLKNDLIDVEIEQTNARKIF